jgi:endonuclease/exonuclease/phosphatase family metal-dependent hydrolase
MRLRVLTLNVWNNQGSPRRTDIINQESRRLNPDLVSLQEVIDGPAQNQLETLLGGLNLHATHQARVLTATPPYSERYGGTAVATRWPHRFVEALDLNVSGGDDVPWRTLAVIVPIPEVGDLLFIGPHFRGGRAQKPFASGRRLRLAISTHDTTLRFRRSSLATLMPRLMPRVFAI